MKKAAELSILCDAEVALIVFSSRGKLYEFSSSSMTKILERHRKCSKLVQDISKDTQDPNKEMMELKRKVDNLQRWRRHIMGEDLDPLSVKELQQLEKQLEDGLKQVKLKKTQIMFDLIEELQKKKQQLEGENKLLRKKLSQLEGRYPCDQYPIHIPGAPWHSTAGNYNTHVHSTHCELILRNGCPSALTGNHSPGQMQSGNYDCKLIMAIEGDNSSI